MGEKGRRGLELLFRKGAEKGLIPPVETFELV
jgi:predicted solute-binding protein